MFSTQEVHVRNLLILFVTVFSVLSAFSAEKCYSISIKKDSFSRTPELLCVDESGAADRMAVITLKSGMPFGEQQQVIATFNLSLTERVRCMDCNEDVFAVASPSNSSFNALAVKFHGSRDRLTGMNESGTVSLGSTVFFYRD